MVENNGDGDNGTAVTDPLPSREEAAALIVERVRLLAEAHGLEAPEPRGWGLGREVHFDWKFETHEGRTGVNLDVRSRHVRRFVDDDGNSFVEEGVKIGVNWPSWGSTYYSALDIERALFIGKVGALAQELALEWGEVTWLELTETAAERRDREAFEKVDREERAVRAGLSSFSNELKGMQVYPKASATRSVVIPALGTLEVGALFEGIEVGNKTYRVEHRGGGHLRATRTA